MIQRLKRVSIYGWTALFLGFTAHLASQAAHQLDADQRSTVCRLDQTEAVAISALHRGAALEEIVALVMEHPPIWQRVYSEGSPQARAFADEIVKEQRR